ncbi:hypothetical protein B0H14DRAFT_3001088, partial [Mycena olivaceomarginata]
DAFLNLFPHTSEDLIDFLSNTLVLNPEKRLTADNALAHPYKITGKSDPFSMCDLLYMEIMSFVSTI